MARLVLQRLALLIPTLLGLSILLFAERGRLFRPT